ncbi:low-complexity tail membrane protein [Picosynechococcus sp. NKBG15041c]|uniref:low-complexity tail membrane protein n=1 Tax=Picosynechococcus sp. NKBG15041c TaxID=1407650 RepID=UPI00046775D2|nr:low-complexity tail membrane protein [Picosynechococcus sp. NKBG15041c]
MLFEPYFWLHIAGLALLPLVWALLAIALAVGIPFPVANLELGLIILLGGMPVWILQILRPWQPFGLAFLQIPPEQLDERQRQILRLVQGTRQPVFNVLGAIAMVILLWQVAHYAPLAIGVAAMLPQWHILGFGAAIVLFFFSNVLFQIPLTLLPALLISEKTVQEIDPHPTVSIRRDFACWGFPLGQLFPPRRLP